MRANEILTFKHRKGDDAGLSAVWDDRKDDIERIRTWLMETADTFIVIQGPRGSGKRELVLDEALKGRRNTLLIDCKPIQEAPGDSSTIFAAAREVGYRPVFSWMNTFSSMIDLAAQGAIGTKTGFSETLDTQLAKIWQNTSNALKELALEGRKKDDKDSELGDDEYLEAHPEKRPVVVIDHFLHKSQESSIVYDKISEWAAALTTANIAHVIFLTNDVSFSKSLSKALPDRVFRQIALGDCSPEVAKKYVINGLNAEAEDGGAKKSLPSQSRNDLDELDGCIDILGGRLTDLEFLMRRIRTGETPSSKPNPSPTRTTTSLDTNPNPFSLPSQKPSTRSSTNPPLRSSKCTSSTSTKPPPATGPQSKPGSSSNASPATPPCATTSSSYPTPSNPPRTAAAANPPSAPSSRPNSSPSSPPTAALAASSPANPSTPPPSAS